jgi:DNA sulfur modification protein DndD
MRLTKLVLNNFRAFYGLHTIEFAHDDDRPVTVFHGENGAGKTTLLNAIHWCVTGDFTPRFQEKTMLVNKAAAKEGEIETYVELYFRNRDTDYRARRSSSSYGRDKGLELYEIKLGNSTPVSQPERALQKIIPKGLVSWFFFDAEAIGSLELSGSSQFKADLRKTLGFELIDRLIKDLEACQLKRQREVSVQTNDRELKALQDEIENIDRVMPGQKQKLATLETEIKAARFELNRLHDLLAKLPNTAKEQARRNVIDSKLRTLRSERAQIEARIANLVGSAAAPIFIKDLAKRFEDKLQVEEVQGRLPAPYSDQLVKDILDSQKCLCGRPVSTGSHEELCIRGLLETANTSVLNGRIREIQFLIRDIETRARTYPNDITVARARAADVDKQIAELEEELAEIKQRLDNSSEQEVRELERARNAMQSHFETLNNDKGAVALRITQSDAKIEELQARYKRTASRLDVAQKLKNELDKITRLHKFLSESLKAQEARALRVLKMELNTILERYLTKHFTAQIDPATYAVKLLDENRQLVGHSTGEGQILKFAFISTVVALAARKTQEKIEWMAEPTVAPLVLDAPLSALDPEYQGSVAKNLAAQTTQLVLMVSSANWGDKVSEALESYVGKRYLIVSKSAGPRGEKPIKTMKIGHTTYTLNAYEAERDESDFVRIP